ncbi:MAG: citrate/2-methylcitrate synthase [Desulfobacterales bacterium]
MGALDDPRLRYDYKNREHGTVAPDTKREQFRWVSEVAYKNVHRIVTRGYDTTELVEAGYGIADVIFIDYQARIPLEEEAKMLNYIMILSLEDGLSAPAAMSRIIASSKTYLTQAAGGSILAFGHAYGAYCAFGSMLDKYLEAGKEQGQSVAAIAETLVKENINDEALGVSDLMLKDPAAKRMIARAEKLGVAGKYIALMKEIVKAAQNSCAVPVDIDMLGAMGATMLDLGFSPESTWAVLAVTRAFGAGAHYCEEVEREDYHRLGQDLTPKESYDGPEDRPVPTQAERYQTVRPGTHRTPQEWKDALAEKKKLKGSGWAIEEKIDDPREHKKT